MIIESNNPEINVDKLMEQVKQEVAKRQSSFPIQLNIVNDFESNEEFSESFYRIESLLNNSALYAQEPTELPQKINRFPFNIKIIKKIIFKIYGFIFKKQRVVNSELIKAFRESLELNQKLMTRLNTIEVKLNDIEAKLNDKLSIK